jgi:hypothetical protein
MRVRLYVEGLDERNAVCISLLPFPSAVTLCCLFCCLVVLSSISPSKRGWCVLTVIRFDW